MKEKELKEIGLTDEQVSKVLALRGAETIELQRRAEAAEEALKKFDGIDPENIQKEIDGYKKQLADRDRLDWITKKFDEYGVASPYARKQLAAECMADEGGLTWKDGAFLGFDDYMKAAKEKDAGLYQTAEEKEAAERSPYFTGKSDNNVKCGKYTPPQIF